MLIKMMSVYAMRSISGLGTLFAILLIGRFYTSVELAAYALFMLMLNFFTVIVLWGDTVKVVEDYNKAESEGHNKIVLLLGHKLLDGGVVLLLSYFILNYVGQWHNGLLAVVPIAIGGVFSALLVAQKKFVSSILCYEFSRAVVPFLAMVMVASVYSGMAFNSLLSVSYLSLFLVLPLLLGYLSRQRAWTVSFAVNLKQWAIDKANALPVVLPQIIIVLVVQADRLVIEYWGSANELAAYFAAQTLYAIVLIVSHSTFNLVIPEVSKVAALGVGDLRKQSMLMFKVQTLLGLLLIPIAYGFFKLIDVDQTISMQVFVLLVGGGFLSSFFGVGLPAMQFCSNKMPYLKVILMGLVLQCLVVISLYMALGVHAAALGFATYNVFTTVFAACYWHRRNVLVVPFFVFRG